MQPSFHGSVANAKSGSDLVIIPILRVFEQQDFRVAGRQAGYCTADHRSPLLGNQPAERIERFTSPAVAMLRLVGKPADQPPPPATLATIKQRLSHREPIQPRRDLAGVGYRRGLPHGCQRHFLHYLIDGLGLADARKGDRSQPAIMLGERRLPVDGGLTHRVAWWPAASDGC